MDRLKDKVALITGAAMGMGEATAALFAREGAKIVAADIDTLKLSATVERINAAGGKAIGIALDVSDESGWADALRRALDEFDTVDILVNNAGVISRKSLEECTLDNWNRVHSINATGVFLGMKTIIPAMQRAGKGSIVNVSSIAGLTGSPFASAGDIAYCASKWAVRGMTKFAANAYAADNIRVNSLHPGPTDTPMFQTGRKSGDGPSPMLIQAVPLPPHVTNSQSQALAAIFLASDEANFITGVELPCDGGFSSS